jgi:HAD superfamily hydrolase (TIGR01549 family)
MIKAVLFDFDGVLIDSLGFYVKAYDLALREFGLVFSDREIVASCFAKTEKEICRNLKIKDVDGFSQAYFDAIDKLFLKVELFPGVLDVFDFLQKKKIKLGITTFAYRWYIDKMINRLNLRKHFKIILSSDDVNKPKPNPEIVLKACKNLKIPKSLALVVGDSKGDIIAGNAAGCQTALFIPEKHKMFYDFNVLRKSKPDFIFSEFTDLKEILKF